VSGTPKVEHLDPAHSGQAVLGGFEAKDNEHCEPDPAAQSTKTKTASKPDRLTCWGSLRGVAFGLEYLHTDTGP